MSGGTLAFGFIFRQYSSIHSIQQLFILTNYVDALALDSIVFMNRHMNYVIYKLAACPRELPIYSVLFLHVCGFLVHTESYYG